MARRMIALLVLAAALTAVGCGQEDSSPTDPGGTGTEGSIAVRSTPGCAGIYLDGVFTGLLTPDTLASVNVGVHEIRVERAGSGGIVATASVTVNGGETADVELSLSDPAATGFISVLSDLAGSAIYIDGLPTCVSAPGVVSGVAVGAREVTVKRLGFTPTPGSMMVTVAAGDTASANFSETADVASVRTALVEHFTNWECAPCLPADPKFDALADSLTRDQIVLIGYHTGVPGPNDPLYVENTVQPNARASLYNVTANPGAFVDGRKFSPPFSSWSGPAAYFALRDSVLADNGMTPDFTVTVAGRIVGNTYYLDAAVTAHDDYSAGGIAIRITLVEKEITVDPAAQPLGQTKYTWVMRRMIPDENGVEITPVDGETVTVSHEIALRSNWVASEMGAIVFVQETGAPNTVLQAGGTF